MPCDRFAGQACKGVPNHRGELDRTDCAVCCAVLCSTVMCAAAPAGCDYRSRSAGYLHFHCWHSEGKPRKPAAVCTPGGPRHLQRSSYCVFQVGSE
jgi:hypothetical protein